MFRGAVLADFGRAVRRRDVWLVILAAPALGAVSYLNAAGGVAVDTDGPGGASSGPGPISAAVQARYAPPGALMTFLESSSWISLAGLYLGAALTGSDYRWGTIRTILLAANSRRRYLAARLATIGGLVAVSYALLTGLGLVVPFLSQGDSEAASTLDPVAVGVDIGGRYLESMFLVTLATLLAVAVRSTGLALLGGMAVVALQPVIAAFPFWPSAGLLSTLPRFLPHQIAQDLSDRTARLAGAIPLPGAPEPEGSMPLWLLFLLLGAWTAIMAAAAYGVLRASQIRE